MSDAICPACGHQARIAGELADAIFRCDECGARIAYGEPMPRLVIEPDTSRPGKNMIVLRVQDPKTRADSAVVRLDPQYAASLSKNILALVLP